MEGGRIRKPKAKRSARRIFASKALEFYKRERPNDRANWQVIWGKAAVQWQKMSDEDKRQFVELAEKDAERYEAEKREYDAARGFSVRKGVVVDANGSKAHSFVSGYRCFTQKRRPELKLKILESSASESAVWRVRQVEKELGRLWRGMSSEEKQTWEEMAANAKESDEQQMEQQGREHPVVRRSSILQSSLNANKLTVNCNATLPKK